MGFEHRNLTRLKYETHTGEVTMEFAVVACGLLHPVVRAMVGR